jgi:hypothetical protein
MQNSRKPNLDKSGVEPVAINGTANGAVLEVRFAFKATAFCASVITLSWFFAGWRQIHESIGFSSVSTLLAGIVCTGALISLQAFWIYLEEKQKGSLMRRIGLFEKLYDNLVQRKVALNAKRGEKAKHA